MHIYIYMYVHAHTKTHTWNTWVHTHNTHAVIAMATLYIWNKWIVVHMRTVVSHTCLWNSLNITYIYIYIYIYKYIYIYEYIHMCVCIYIYMYVHTHTYVHAHTHNTHAVIAMGTLSKRLKWSNGHMRRVVSHTCLWNSLNVSLSLSVSRKHMYVHLQKKNMHIYTHMCALIHRDKPGLYSSTGHGRVCSWCQGSE